MTHSRRSIRLAGRVFLIGLVTLAIGAAAGSIWIGVRALSAESELRSVQGSLAQLRETMTSDPSAVGSSLESLQRATSRARDLTSDVVWRAAEQLPWVGTQLHAVSTVASSLDAVVREVGPLVGSAGLSDLSRFAPTNGQLDTEVLAALQEPADRAAATAREAADAVGSIDPNALVTPLVAPVAEATSSLEELAGLTRAFSTASNIVPAILGADGPRNYLLMMQNNAEWRSLGGIPGAAMLLHTDAGRMQIVEQVAGGSLSGTDVPDLVVDPEIEDLFGVRPGRWFQNTTQVPDFAEAGSLAAEYWQRARGTQVNGVISVDPIALSYVLAATGPITLSTGDTLNAENAADFLLNGVYLKYPVKETDAIFAEAAAAVFDALVAGGSDPALIVPAVIRGIDERRILLWSADPSEQAQTAGLTIAGGLPTSDADTSRFGVYVNEGGGAKIDYYLALGASASHCGAGQAELRVTIQSNAPENVETYPTYIHAGGMFGVDPRIARTVAYVYLPPGATLISAEPTNGGLGGQRQHKGLDVLTWQSDLAPGEVATLDVLVDLPGAQGLEVITTPTINTLDTLGISDFCDLAEY